MDNITKSAIFSIFSIFVLIGDIFLFALLYLYFLKNKVKEFLPIAAFVKNNSLVLSFLTASFATVGSLFLSEFLKLPPCKLCWYQRIFLYPQTILLAIALLTNDNLIKKYIIPLSLIGLSIAIYHYVLQLYPTILPCSDETVSCAKVQFKYFGYITIPMMSSTTFALIIIFQLFLTRDKKTK